MANLPPDRDWNRSIAWTSDHPVRAAFSTLRDSVAAVRGSASNCLPSRLSLVQQQVLRANRERILAAAPHPELQVQAANALQRVRRGVLDDAGRTERMFAQMLGLPAADMDLDRVRREGRDFAFLQCLAMRPGYWDDPVRFILFSVFTYAFELAMGRRYGKPEPIRTEALVNFVHSAVEHRIITAMNDARAFLPARHRLDLGTGSMQERHDLLAADLAVIVGVEVCGRPMYRVVLFQAKHLASDGQLNLTVAERGQLDKLLSTGMGWYLFYPKSEEAGRFLGVTMSARDVFQSVWCSPRDRRRAGVDVFGSGTRRPVWDFPSLVGVGMYSNLLKPGRLFPSAAAVNQALSLDRAKPLVAGLIAADTTKSLQLRDILDAAAASGMTVRQPVSVPSWWDGPPPDELRPEIP